MLFVELLVLLLVLLLLLLLLVVVVVVVVLLLLLYQVASVYRCVPPSWRAHVVTCPLAVHVLLPSSRVCLSLSTCLPAAVHDVAVPCLGHGVAGVVRV